MRFYTKLIPTALAAMLLLAIGLSSAAARTLMVNEKNFEIIWSEALGSPKTKLEIISRTANFNIQCRVTFLGHWNEHTIIKETTRDQGVINHGELGSCEGGTATLKTETMPWGLRYVSFAGTLPRISSVGDALIGARWLIREPGGRECDSGTEVSHPSKAIVGSSGEATEVGLETTGEPNNITAERGARIPFRGEFPCGIAGEAEFGGIGLIRNLPRNALIRLTLI